MSEKISNLSAFIEENFGANATYVEGLLARYKADPKSVDESWQEYFAGLMTGDGQLTKVETLPVGAQAETRPVGSVSEPTKRPAKTEKPAPKLPPDTAPKPITGRCLCGAVTYSVDADPVVQVACHCTDCQRQTGGPFSVIVGVPRAALNVEGSRELAAENDELREKIKRLEGRLEASPGTAGRAPRLRPKRLDRK